MTNEDIDAIVIKRLHDEGHLPCAMDFTEISNVNTIYVKYFNEIKQKEIDKKEKL